MNSLVTKKFMQIWKYSEVMKTKAMHAMEMSRITFCHLYLYNSANMSLYGRYLMNTLLGMVYLRLGYKLKVYSLKIQLTCFP